MKQVCKSFAAAGQTVTALRAIDLQLQPREFVAITGPSGCGKSTLLFVLGGLLQPDAGDVCLGDDSLYLLPQGRRAQVRAERVGFVFQQFHLVPYLSVWENILAARLPHRSGENQAVTRRAADLLERFGMAARRDHLPGQLSTGEKQRAALARALLNEPSLLLADEPTGNLDAVNAQVVLDQLAEFAEQGGTTVLVTHDLRAAQRAQRLVRLEAGQITADECLQTRDEKGGTL